MSNPCLFHANRQHSTVTCSRAKAGVALRACRMQAAVSGAYGKVGALASLAAKLNRHRPSIVIALVDILLEDMHEALLATRPPSPQRRLAHARLLGELYNHQVIRSQLLFYALYLTITLGVLPQGVCFYLLSQPGRQA